METASNSLILIVDDNPNNLAVLSSALSSAGYTVAVETDGEGAIDLVQYNPPDLILLDVMMPGIDGFETCRRLKAQPNSQNIPVIFMTALADADNKVKGLVSGAVDYITKPFQQEEVLARVRLHLQLNRLTKSLEEKNAILTNFNKELETQVAKRTAELAAANSKLAEYSQGLETKVAERTKELEVAQQQIIAKEKLASLGALTAGIAHEIRNPLNFVNNYAESSVEIIDELLTETEVQAKSEDWLAYLRQSLIEIKGNAQAIYEHGQRASGIIQSMMQHTGNSQSRKQLASLSTLLNQAWQLAYHSRWADDLQVQVVTNYASEPEMIELFTSEINRAFINILDNSCYALAAKYKQMGDYGPTVHLEIADRPENVLVRIRDNGIGMDIVTQERVFEPFFTTKPPGEGTGLGLSLTHDIIVGQHGGNIYVQTEPGHYTEFLIELPKNITNE
jgi:signal transduction histidine kinase